MKKTTVCTCFKRGLEGFNEASGRFKGLGVVGLQKSVRDSVSRVSDSGLARILRVVTMSPPVSLFAVMGYS